MINLLVDDINCALDNNCYFAALSLALTLPDICGKAEYPNAKPSERYLNWCYEYVSKYEKPTDNYDPLELPYLSEEIIYKLRNAFLHQGNPNIKKNEISEKRCQVDKLILRIYDKDALETRKSGLTIDRANRIEKHITVSVYFLCQSIALAAEEYYNKNKEKFNFFNYHLEVYNSSSEYSFF